MAKNIYANEDDKSVFDHEESTNEIVNEIVEVKIRLMNTDIKNDLGLSEIKEFKHNMYIGQKKFLNKSKILEIDSHPDPFDEFVKSFKSDIDITNWSNKIVDVFKIITSCLSPGLNQTLKVIRLVFGWYSCRGVK